MKTGYKLTVIALLLSYSLFGQIDSLEPGIYDLNTFDQKWEKCSYLLESDVFIGSNAINTQVFTDVLFNSSFKHRAKEKYLQSDKRHTKVYGHIINQGEFKLSKELGLFVKHKNVFGLQIHSDMAALLVWGNAPFAGKPVKSNNIRLVNANTVGLGLSHKLFASDRYFVKGFYGLSLITSLTEFEAQKMDIFTAKDGSYIDVNIDDLTISESKTGVRGAGIDLGFEMEYKLNAKSSLSLNVLDLNYNLLTNSSNINLDTNFRFSGVDLDLFSGYNKSFTEISDSLYNDVLLKSRHQKKAIMLPSRLELNWNRKINNKHILIIGLQANDFGRLGVTSHAGFGYSIKPNVKLLSSLAFGNYSGFVCSETLEYYTGNGFYIRTKISNLHAVIAPYTSTSYGFSFTLSKIL